MYFILPSGNLLVSEATTMQLDPDVIRLAMRGDIQAYRKLVEHHQAFAYAVAYRMLGNEDEAEDMVQEVFIKLWKVLPGYRQEIKLTTWLYKIITNQCLDHLKSNYRKANQNRKSVLDLVIQAPGTPDNELQQREWIVQVQEAAAALTPTQKAVFVLRDLQGLDVEEVCQVLEMNDTQVKSNLYHARKAIAQQLEKYYQASKTEML